MAKIMGSEGITTTLQVYLYGHQEQVTNLLNESLAQADLMLEGKDLKALINHIVPASWGASVGSVNKIQQHTVKSADVAYHAVIACPLCWSALMQDGSKLTA